MTQPPVPGCDAGDEPGRDPGPSGGGPDASSAGHGQDPPRAGRGGGPASSVFPVGGRDGRLAPFAHKDAGDRFPPGWWLAMMVDELSGPDRRCPAATDDELIGLLGRWQALESWASAGKLGVVAQTTSSRTTGPVTTGISTPMTPRTMSSAVAVLAVLAILAILAIPAGAPATVTSPTGPPGAPVPHRTPAMPDRRWRLIPT